MKRWTVEENKIMSENYGKVSTGGLALRLRRSRKAIIDHAYWLGLHYYPEMPYSLTIEQTQVIIGSLLGDAHCRPARHNPGLQFCCKEADTDYLVWKYEILKSLCGNLGFHPYTDKRGNSVMVQFNTRSSPLLREFHQAFYINSRKIYPVNKLPELEALGLAVWFMDDGSISKGFARLATLGFTIEENCSIKDYFKKQWNIGAKVQFDNNGNHKLPYLEFNKAETQKLIDIISPYILPCMSRKIGLRS